ncbi:MAG: alpha/beta hydrolase, partial [Brachybacterium sp.]|nr:alpha/beta hydrolase [Brachybacterium sp.]
PRHSTALLGVPYAEQDGRTLHLQILLPPQVVGTDPADGQRLPGILYVQGSGWREQNLGGKLPALAEMACRGYVIAIVEHRPSAQAPFPAQAEDAARAVHFLREHAGEYFVNPDRLAIWGDSSGGHTALTAYLRDPALDLRCAVDYFAPTDISRMNEEPSISDHLAADSAEGLLIGGRRVDEHPELVAPTILMGGVVPAAERAQHVLIVHGSHDRVVPFAQSVLLHEELRAAGQDTTLVRVEGADHSGAPFWQPTVLDLVEEFLRRCLA